MDCDAVGNTYDRETLSFFGYLPRLVHKNVYVGIPKPQKYSAVLIKACYGTKCPLRGRLVKHRPPTSSYHG